ncbi:MAG: hypothetical protein VW270_22985, partial [Candidatus Poseidoniales archaeon]
MNRTSYTHVSSLEAFLEERFVWGGKPYYWHRAIRGWYPALDHVIDEDGKLLSDTMIEEGHAV